MRAAGDVAAHEGDVQHARAARRRRRSGRGRSARRASSRRWTRWPTKRLPAGVASVVIDRASLVPARRPAVAHGLDDPLVAGAAAEVAGQAVADLVVGRGRGCRSRKAVTDTTKPGVQNPHCRPWHSWNACCTGLSVPSAAARPSTVVTSAPSACTANSRHERTASPSSSTVQAPHTPCSQPRWVPVRREVLAQEVGQRACAASTRPARGVAVDASVDRRLSHAASSSRLAATWPRGDQRARRPCAR